MLRLATLALAGGLVALPSAAWAHATFVSASSVPPNSDQKLVIDVPEEKGPNTHNAKIIFEVPGGFTVAGCDSKPEWSCTTSPASGGRTLVTYTRGAGANPDGHFSFGVHTPSQAGDYQFQTNQTYGDGSSAHWEGPPNSDYPAPVLHVG